LRVGKLLQPAEAARPRHQSSSRPNPAPVGDAVKVTVVPVSYVPVQTDPPDPVQPGPQWIRFGVPVSEGAVTNQVVVFSPAL